MVAGHFFFFRHIRKKKKTPYSGIGFSHLNVIFVKEKISLLSGWSQLCLFSTHLMAVSPLCEISFPSGHIPLCLVGKLCHPVLYCCSQVVACQAHLDSGSFLPFWTPGLALHIVFCTVDSVWKFGGGAVFLHPSCFHLFVYNTWYIYNLDAPNMGSEQGVWHTGYQWCHL